MEAASRPVPPIYGPSDADVRGGPRPWGGGGSIRGGALLLGLGQPTVSGRVARLEARLGGGLFTRDKPGTALTEELETRLDRDLGREPPALSEIDWVTWSKPYETVAPRPMLERAIPDFEPSFASDNYLVLRAAVAAGLGAMILDSRGAANEQPEALTEIDLGFTLPASEFFLVCAKSVRFVPRVRVVAEQITTIVGAAEAVEDTTPP